MIQRIGYAVIAISTTVAAQRSDDREIRRERALGMVANPAGKPWAHARVRLVHRLHPETTVGEPADVVDVVEVIADATGRWRADVLAGQPYGAWAFTKDGEVTFRCTPFLEDVVAGLPTMLVEGEPRRHVDVQIVGLDRWQHFAPLRVTVASRRLRPQLVRPVKLDERGRFRVPALPSDTLSVEVFGKGGHPIHIKTLRRITKNQTNPRTITVPPPYPFRFKVYSSNNSPIAGAEILGRMSTTHPWTRIGRSDARGFCTVDLGLAKDSRGKYAFGGDFLSHADGFTEGFAGHLYRNEFGTAKWRKFLIETGGADLGFQLYAGFTIRGRILIRADVPLRNATILLYSEIKTGSNSSRVFMLPRAFRSDADGRFSIPGRSSTHAYRLTVLLVPAARSELQRDPRRPLASECLLARGVATEDAKLGDIRLDRFPVLRVNVREPVGTPAQNAKVSLAELARPGGARTPTQSHPMRFRPDRVGRLAVLVNRLDGLGVFAESDRGFLTRKLTAADQADQDVEMNLDKTLILRGRVLNQNGRPLPNASVRLVGAESLTGTHPAGLVDQVNRFFRFKVMPHTDVRTGQDGSFRMVIPCHDLKLEMVISNTGGKTRQVHVRFEKDRIQGPVRVEVEAPDPHKRSPR